MLELTLVQKGGGSSFTLIDHEDGDETRSKKIAELAETMARNYPETAESVINDWQAKMPIRDLLIGNDITPATLEEFLAELAECHLQENSDALAEMADEY